MLWLEVGGGLRSCRLEVLKGELSTDNRSMEEGVVVVCKPADIVIEGPW